MFVLGTLSSFVLSLTVLYLCNLIFSEFFFINYHGSDLKIKNKKKRVYGFQLNCDYCNPLS